MQCNESRGGGDQAMDVRQCLFWELFSWSEARVALYFIPYSALLTVAVAMNCYLLYSTARGGNVPDQPHYTVLLNIAACNILIAVTPGIYMLPHVLRGSTATLSNWCVSFVGTMGSLLLAYQMTLVLFAIERYVFVCHESHYRSVRKGHVGCALGAIWAVAGHLMVNYGVLFGRKWRLEEDEPVDTLVCDPYVFERHTELTPADMAQLHGPPTFVIVASAAVVSACFLQMFRAACSKTPEPGRQSNNHHVAASTVALYLAMVLAPFLPMCCALATLSLPDTYPQGQLLLLFLAMVPPLVNVAVPLYCTAELKRPLLSLCRRREEEGHENIQMRG